MAFLISSLYYSLRPSNRQLITGLSRLPINALLHMLRTQKGSYCSVTAPPLHNLYSFSKEYAVIFLIGAARTTLIRNDTAVKIIANTSCIQMDTSK